MNANFLRTILTAAHCICITRGERSTTFSNDLASFTVCQKQTTLTDPFGSKQTNRFNQIISLNDDNGEPLESQQIWDMWDQKITTKMSSFNHIDVKIGSRDFTTGVLQGAESAYAMYGKKGDISEKPDIGLIVVKRKINWDGDYPVPVGPLCLPSR